jgi:hypothetical protein
MNTEYRIVERAGVFRAQYRDIWAWWPLRLTQWCYALKHGCHREGLGSPEEWDSYEKAEEAITDMLAKEKREATAWQPVAGT